MGDKQAEAKMNLISLLKEKRAVLMAGAGCSKLVGFPLWNELLEEMRKNFYPSSSSPQDVGPIVYADEIKDKIFKDNRKREYFKFLERTFQPKSSGNHTEFHCALVQLGFSGIITANYDIVLETAVSDAFTKDGIHWHCVPIDLCLNDKPYRVFDFLRRLSLKKDHDRVLHVHGCWDNPENIILTEKDYLRAYGELREHDVRRILDTIHRKVLWSVLSMHSFLFVGFSMEDPFFMRMLSIVQQDFALDAEPIHYAIMPYKSDDDIEKIRIQLKRKGIEPLFYKVTKSGSSMEDLNHRELEKIVFELADSLGIQVASPGIADVTRRMMER